MELYRLRPAACEESEAVAQLHRLAQVTAMPYLPALHTPEDDCRFFRERVFRECDVVVAESEAGIAGYCAWRPGWIDHLYVHPLQQCRGVGSLLLERALLQNDELHLWVFQRNEIAICFYRSRGFRLVRTTDGLGNDEREPDALYAWSHLR